MQYINNDQKAKMYDNLLSQFQRLQEEVRLIKSKNFELSQTDENKIKFLEHRMRIVYNQARKLF